MYLTFLEEKNREGRWKPREGDARKKKRPREGEGLKRVDGKLLGRNEKRGLRRALLEQKVEQDLLARRP